MVARAHAVSASEGLALRIENLSHGFALDGQHLPVLERVSLDVAPGEFVALLGAFGVRQVDLAAPGGRPGTGGLRPLAGRR